MLTMIEIIALSKCNPVLIYLKLLVISKRVYMMCAWRLGLRKEHNQHMWYGVVSC